LALRPWELERLSAAEVLRLRRGEQVRFNRTLRVVAWVTSQILQHITAAAGGGDDPKVRRHMSDLEWPRLVKRIPGYDRDIERRPEEDEE